MGGINWDYSFTDNNSEERKTILLEIDYKYYGSYTERKGQHSGHYIFRTNTRRPLYLIEKVVKVEIFNGRLVQQISIVYDKVIMHVRILKNRKRGLEIESLQEELKMGRKEEGMEAVLSIRPAFSNIEGIHS